MRSAFATDIARSIRGSLGRFLAIMGIVALGCGFFAGLQMCGPDMRAEADALYDGTALWDLRLISTLGFTDDDISRIAQVEGVEQAVGSLTCDAMARLGDEQIAVRVSTIDADAARDSWREGAYEVRSEDPRYLNRPFLVEGRWPEAEGECVICADVLHGGVGIGDAVELLYGASDLDELLGPRTLTVVGTVSASNYPYTGSFGSTNLGAGKVDQYLYVSEASLAKDAPYTEAYLLVRGAREELSESDAYDRVVAPTKARLEDLASELSHARQGDLRAKAQKKLDEKWDQYHEEKDKADKELADAKKKLDDAEAELARGQKEIDEGAAEYQKGLAEFQREEAAAYEKLDAGEAELAASQRTIDEKAAELADGKKQLADGERKLDEAEAQLKEGAKKLADSETELKAGEDKLKEGQEELDARRAEAEAKLAEGEQAWAAQRASLEQASQALAATEGALQALDGVASSQEAPTKEEVEALRAQLQGAAAALAGLSGGGLDGEAAQALEDAGALVGSALGELAATDLDDSAALAQLHEHLAALSASTAAATGAVEAVRSQVDEGIATGDETLAQERTKALSQLDEAQATIDASRAELEQGRAKLEQGRAEQQAGQKKVDDGRRELKDNRTKLADGAAQLEEGRRKLADGRAELAEARKTAEEGLAEGRAELEAAAEKLRDARIRLDDGRREYEQGKRDYADGKDEADRRFADARRQLDDGQRKIDEIELPDIYALDRSQSEGAATYHADASRIDAIADVFPLFFFLVAALVALTTMTRMVEDDRVLIGTYKALGYGTGAIAAKYLVYAGIAGTVGAAIGIAILSQVLPVIVTSSYGIIYTVPLFALPLPIDPLIALVAGGLGVGVTLAATWGAVVSSLREVPATLMLPRAPKAGKRILLERIGPIWRRLSFTWKVTLRNLFRYKRRLLMTVIGISGCTALLLVGFGLHDAIWDIIDKQYGPIVHFDTTVGLDDDANELDVGHVTDYLESTGEVSGIVRVQSENMQASGVDGDETMRVNVVVPRDVDEMAGAITFRERVSGAPVAMGDDSVLLTEKLAMKFGLRTGDEVVLYEQDDVGNAQGAGHRLRVSGVVENYVGNIVYVGREAWGAVEPGEPAFSCVYASVTPDDEVRAWIAEGLRDIDGVSTVIYSDETISMYRNMLSVVDLVVVVLIVSAAALAYIVLYNLTNINIGERIREIASIKVLGFTRREVYTYIFREIALLALMGDMLGLAMGIILERFVVVTAEVDYVMFGRAIHPPSFAYAFALTMVFTGLVMLSMRHKLDRVDMVESLKSVD